MSPAIGMGGVAWVGARAAAAASSMNGAGSFSQAATNQTTQQLQLNLLRLSAARSVRTSTIILATFNTIAAFATAFGILYDTYTRTKRNNRRYQFSRQGFQFVPSTEVYPLVLSVGIVIQGTTFAYAQSLSLDSLYIRGCTLVAQFMLPALLLVPFIQFVFAIETAIRGLKKTPFAPRGKWTVVICLTKIGLFVLASFLVADFVRSSDLCFGSLFWYVTRYSMGLFALFTAMSAVLLACIVAIFWRLRKGTRIEVTERVNASRMVYYLALAFVSNAFMLPFFFSFSFRSALDSDNQSLTLSMIASVVDNVQGLMTGGLYLFLKSTTSSTIGPKNTKSGYQRQNIKNQIRRYGTNDSELSSHMMRITRSRSSSRNRADDASSLASNEKAESSIGRRESSSTWSRIDDQPPNPLRSNTIQQPASSLQQPQPTRVSLFSMRKKKSYSIFPSNPASAKSSIALLPTTTYNPRSRDAEDNLKPPPSMRNFANRHRRDSSMISSATVQMVLRLSSAEDVPPPSNRVTRVDPDTVSVDWQKEDAKEFALKRANTTSTMETVVADSDDLPDHSPTRDRGRDVKMKTLPPVPAVEANLAGARDESNAAVQPSPTVYSPQTARVVRLPPMERISNNTSPTAVNRSPRSPEVKTPPPRRAGDTTPLPEHTKADWI